MVVKGTSMHNVVALPCFARALDLPVFLLLGVSGQTHLDHVELDAVGGVCTPRKGLHRLGALRVPQLNLGARSHKQVLCIRGGREKERRGGGE